MSPQNNSIVVGGPRRPAPRRSHVSQVADIEESDVEMNIGSPASTIDQPIEGSVIAKSAVASNTASAVIGTSALTSAAMNGIDESDDKYQVVAKPKTVTTFTIPVHSKTAPVNTAKPTIEEITIRQLQEDMDAYEKDQDFCAALLDHEDLTPQETRTIKIRQFDLMHQLRATKHRHELLVLKSGPVRGRPAKATAPTASQAVSASLCPNPATTAGPSGPAAHTNGGPTPTPHGPGTPVPSSDVKPKTGKKRASLHRADDDLSDGDPGSPSGTPGPDKRPRLALTAQSNPEPSEYERYNEVKRLGYWTCRLCQSHKYLNAPTLDRHPAMACKWPLRDTSKLVGHHTEMHQEHTAAERCAELAVALDHNRGPLEYWLTNTKAFDIGDGTVINEIINELRAGRMHHVLRQLNRAARDMKVE